MLGQAVAGEALASGMGGGAPFLRRFLMKGWLALSPFFFLVFLVLPALEDWRTGYISDGWSILLALSGLMTAFWRQELSASLFSAAFVFMIYGALCLIAKNPQGQGIWFYPPAQPSGWARYPVSFYMVFRPGGPALSGALPPSWKKGDR